MVSTAKDIWQFQHKESLQQMSIANSFHFFICQLCKNNQHTVDLKL